MSEKERALKGISRRERKKKEHEWLNIKYHKTKQWKLCGLRVWGASQKRRKKNPIHTIRFWKKKPSSLNSFSWHGSCSVCVLLQYYFFLSHSLSFSFSLCLFAMFLFQFRMFLNMSHIWYGQESFYGCMRQSAKCIFFFSLHCICKTVLNYDIYSKQNEAINNEMNVYVIKRKRDGERNNKKKGEQTRMAKCKRETIKWWMHTRIREIRCVLFLLRDKCSNVFAC